MLTVEHLTALAQDRGGGRLSLFVPTRRTWLEAKANRIRLKNLLRHTAQALADRGAGARDIDALLGPAREFADDPRQWRSPGDGLALFIGPDTVRPHRVPLRLPNLAIVGDHFVIRPLLPLLGMNAHFFVLALSYDDLRLYEGGPTGLREMSLDGLQLAAWQTMPRCRPRPHAFVADRGGPGARAVFHGEPDDDHEERVYQHYRRVDRSLRGVVGHDAPVVLCGNPRLQALYRRADTSGQLVAGGIDGSIHDVTPERLHRRAWQLVEPRLREQEAAAAARHRDLLGTGRTSDDPAAILDAARRGQVETLFLSVDAPEWQSGASGRPVVRIQDGTDADPLDSAAVHTLAHGGQVYAVPAARMPTTDAAAATLRYPALVLAEGSTP